jgi:hypothetical protein
MSRSSSILMNMTALMSRCRLRVLLFLMAARPAAWSAATISASVP